MVLRGRAYVRSRVPFSRVSAPGTKAGALGQQVASGEGGLLAELLGFASNNEWSERS